MKSILLSFLLLILPVNSWAEVRIASWNIQRMTSENKDMNAIVKIASYFDVIGIQEVMEEQALVDLAQKLTISTNEEWGVLVSHPIGRGSYKESYGFIWRKSQIDYYDSAVVYLDDNDVFTREPLSAKFQLKTGEKIILANVHILYGDSKNDRIPEIKALSNYWEWLAATFPNEQYIILGDFNLNPNEPEFDSLKKYAYPAITSGASTLKNANSEYANLYDNIWYPKNLDGNLSSGILRYPEILNWTHEYAKAKVSDHAPVFLIIKRFDDDSGLFQEKFKTDYVINYVRGNKNSMIYHLKGCPSYKAMEGSENLVEFFSEQDAVYAGYKKAGNCN